MKIETIGVISGSLKSSSKTYKLDDGSVLVYDPTGVSKSLFIRLETNRIFKKKLLKTENQSDRCIVLLDGPQLLNSRGQVFDITTNQWDHMSRIPPTAVDSNNVGTMLQTSNNCVYIFCYDGNVKCLDLERARQGWNARPKHKCIFHRGKTMMAVECEKKMYLLAGRTICCYQHGSWKSLPDLSVARQWGSVVAINHFLVILGGMDQSQGMNDLQNPALTIEIYNTRERRSSLLDLRLPGARRDASLITHEGSIYLFGGGAEDVLKIKIPLPNPPPESTPPRLHFKPRKKPEASAGESNKNIQRCRKPESSTMTISLPPTPQLPDIPFGSTTVQGRIDALRRYRSQLEQIQSAYQETVTQNEEQVLLILRQAHQLWKQEVERRKNEALAIETCLQEQVSDIVELQDEDDFCDNVPSQLRCPITLQLMKDPVVASDGNAYERSALEEWFLHEIKRKQGSNTSATSPATGATMKSRVFHPCHVLKQLCKQYRDQQQHL